MSERTSYAPGTPSWVDLGSPDLDAAVEFYGALFGWEVAESQSPEQTGGYRIAILSGKTVAGMMPLMQEGQPPAWTTYVSVEDADATAAAVERGRRQCDCRADGRDGRSAGWRSSPTRPAPCSASGSRGTFPGRGLRQRAGAHSPGTSSTPATPMPRRRSTRPSSAGGRRARHGGDRAPTPSGSVGERLDRRDDGHARHASPMRSPPTGSSTSPSRTPTRRPRR